MADPGHAGDYIISFSIVMFTFRKKLGRRCLGIFSESAASHNQGKMETKKTRDMSQLSSCSYLPLSEGLEASVFRFLCFREV